MQSHTIEEANVISRAGVLTTRSELSKPAEKQINHHQPVHPAVLTIRVVQVGAGAGSHAPQVSKFLGANIILSQSSTPRYVKAYDVSTLNTSELRKL